MSSAGGPSLAHRAVSNIRTTTTHPPAGQPGPTSPHTPSRAVPSAFGSPSSLRAEDDIIVVEVGSRFVRVGFAGDALPKAALQLGPQQQRRVGDHRQWSVGYQDDWTRREIGGRWSEDHELWRLDLRGLDMGLVEDKLDRVLREAFTKYLLVDSRPRKVAFVLPSMLPVPLLSAVLNTIFNRFQAPFVSLLSSAVTATVAAGVRSALVIDLGWAETTVTSVYEYREVRCARTVRAGRVLVDGVHELLREALGREGGQEEQQQQRIVSFDECEDIACRLLWCRRPDRVSSGKSPQGLPTLHEQDESDAGRPRETGPADVVSIPLRTSQPPTTVQVPFQKLAEVCEKQMLDLQCVPTSFDDHELPVHFLIYQQLLRLPMDVRAVCMSRIIFIGGCANVLGLKGRIFDELTSIVNERGWDPVQGHGVQQLKTNPKLRRSNSRQASSGPVGIASQQGDVEDDQDGVWHDAANAAPEPDPVEEQLRRGRGRAPAMRGTLRCIGSLGAWGGASLACQLKIASVATVDRELWLLHGPNGASKPGEMDVRMQQRQSMGPGGLLRGSGAGQTSWTLGTWGYA